MTTVLTPDDDGEFTELRDADIPRVDLVDKAANGTRFIIAKQADDRGGLIAPDVVRDLIGKSEPEPPRAEREIRVTVNVDPGAVAKAIHEAAERAVAKADESTASINDLPDSDFAYIEPGGSKDESGKTTPRSLRHFPIHDAAHVRNALARAPQSPFGDKAMPAIRSAAKKFGIEVAKADTSGDDLDTTTVLAEPDGNTPGNPTMPGSPAWEAIDAATACKWTALLARARSAVSLLADREMLEAASGDEDDADQAWDLQDACCAIDYAISVLAPFAVAEQAEADKGEEFSAFGKALDGFDTAALDTIESLGVVRKAGRVLSAANEQQIRSAAESLQKVLASLPQAPTADDTPDSGLPVAKTANEETTMATPTLTENVTAESGQESAMGTQEPESKPVAGQAVTVVGKADGEGKPAMVAVYDQKGHLVGIVDPSEITPIAGAGDDDTDSTDTDGGDGDGAAQPHDADSVDLEPQPGAEAGIPADAVDDAMAKAEQSTTQQSDNDKTDTTSDVFKSIAETVVKAHLDAHSATQADIVTKQSAAILELADTVETLKGQVKALEEQPAEPKVFTNGAVPPAHQMRGQNAGATPVDMAKAAELRKQLYHGATSGDQNQAAIDLQTMAIAQLREIHHGGARQ